MSSNNVKISNAEQMTIDIYNLYNKGLSSYIDKFEAEKRFDDQVKYEEQYKNDNRVCHTDGSDSILGTSISDLSGINRDAIIKGLKTKFYDYNFMNKIRCMINMIVDMKDGNNDSERSRIHRFIADPMRFGAPSAFNYAMRADLVTSDDYGKDSKRHDTFKGDMVVIKCPREPSSAKELIHELCVGLRLFELRKYGCCNFSMVYDAWYCSAPVVNDTTNEVNNWCMASDNPVSYVAYEMIHDAFPIDIVSKDKTPGIAIKCAKYLMQMALAEYLAQAFAGFQHYDAHGGNLLLRPYNNSDFYMYYPFEGVEYYVPSPGEIVTFIDYGMSRIIMEDGTSIGKLDATGRFKSVGIADPDDGDVLGDVYKLICVILRLSIYYGNNELSTFLGELLNDFFYRDENPNWNVIVDVLDKQSALVYLLPVPLIKEKGLHITDFIKHLRKYTLEKYGVQLMVESVPKDGKIFGHEVHFETELEVKEQIGLKISEVPTLYDLAFSIESEDGVNPQILENVNKNFQTIIHNELVSIISILNNNSSTGFLVLGSTRNDIETEKEHASRIIESVAKVANNCYKLIEKLKSYRICSSVIDKQELRDLISQCQERLTRDTSYIERIKSTLIQNEKKISDAMKSPRTDFVFIKPGDKPPKDIEGVVEGSDPPVDPLFNLSDKYEMTISALRKMSITL